MNVASRRKARLLAARRKQTAPFGLAGGVERPMYDGVYHMAVGNASGYSGHLFWAFFDWLPRHWRDAINYAPNQSAVVAVYRNAAEQLYGIYAARTTPQGG